MKNKPIIEIIVLDENDIILTSNDDVTPIQPF